jgi:hypothetical protein
VPQSAIYSATPRQDRRPYGRKALITEPAERRPLGAAAARRDRSAPQRDVLQVASHALCALHDSPPRVQLAEIIQRNRVVCAARNHRDLLDLQASAMHDDE